MKKLIIIGLFSYFPLITFGQVNWEKFLASANYKKWDSIKCKEFYNIAEYEIGFIDKPPKIHGMDKMLKKMNHPSDIPESLRLEGKVIFRFVVTKTGEIECLKVYSALPDNYINAAILAFKELNFESAENNGQKFDFRMVIPITFSNGEINQNKKLLKAEK